MLMQHHWFPGLDRTFSFQLVRSSGLLLPMITSTLWGPLHSHVNFRISVGMSAPADPVPRVSRSPSPANGNALCPQCLLQDLLSRHLLEVPSQDLRLGLRAGQDTGNVLGSPAQSLRLPSLEGLSSTVPTLSSCPHLLQLQTLLPKPCETAGPPAALKLTDPPRLPLHCHRAQSSATCSPRSGNMFSCMLSSVELFTEDSNPPVLRAPWVRTEPPPLCSSLALLPSSADYKWGEHLSLIPCPLRLLLL